MMKRRSWAALCLRWLRNKLSPRVLKNQRATSIFASCWVTHNLDNDSYLPRLALRLWISLRSPCITPWNKHSKQSYRSLHYFPDATSKAKMSLALSELLNPAPSSEPSSPKVHKPSGDSNSGYARGGLDIQTPYVR